MGKEHKCRRHLIRDENMQWDIWDMEKEHKCILHFIGGINMHNLEKIRMALIYSFSIKQLDSIFTVLATLKGMEVKEKAN